MIAVIPWQQLKNWRATLIIAPSVGRRWSRPVNCPARIYSIRKWFPFVAFWGGLTFCTFRMCLQSWLEQDKSCPTCRLTLNIENPSDNRPHSPEIPHNAPPTVRRPLNHFFHFDGECSLFDFVEWVLKGFCFRFTLRFMVAKFFSRSKSITSIKPCTGQQLAVGCNGKTGS